MLFKSVIFDVESSHFCTNLATQHKESADFGTMGTHREDHNFSRQDLSHAAYIEEDLDDYFLKVSFSSEETKTDTVCLKNSLKVQMTQIECEVGE